MLAEGGLSTAVTYFTARDLSHNRVDDISHTLSGAVVGTLGLAGLMSVVLVFAADTVIGIFDTLQPNQRTAAALAVRIGVICLISLLLQNVAGGLLHGLQCFGLSNILSTIQVALNTIGFIVISERGGGVAELMTWQAAVSVASLALYALTVRRVLRPFPIKLRFDVGRIIPVWRYAIMTWVGTLGGVLFTQIDRLVVGKYLGTSTLAVYGAITGVVKQINTFTAVPVQPLLPQVTQLTSSDREADKTIRAKVRKALHVNTVGALGLGIALFTLAPLAMPVLLDRAATQTEINGLRMASVIYAVFSLNGVGYYVLLAMNGVRAFMIIQLLSGVLAVTMIALGTRFGLLGAMAGNMGYLGVTAFSLLGMKYLKVSVFTWLGWIRPALIWAAATAIVTLLVPQQVVFLLLAALIQCAVLAYWFAREQPSLFQSLTHPWRPR